MAQQQFRGSTQIMSGTIPWAAMAAGAIVPTASLVDTFLKANGTVALTGALNAGSNLLSSVATPVSGTDAATKAYVDSKVAGFQIHFVRLASAANVALTGEQTIDGVTTSASRVLLTAQTTTSQNGEWITGSGSWTRPTDWAAASTLPEGQYIIVEDEGTTYKNTKWFCTVAGTIVVDTTAATFSQDTSGTSYSNGNGLSLTGSVFAVKTGNGVAFDGSNNVTITPDPNRLLQVIAAGVGIKDGTAGQILLANASGNAAYATLSGDATLASSGALTLATTVLKYANVITGEVPTGTINGSNVTFTLANTPQLEPAVYLNGQRKLLGAGNDYTRSGATLTFLTAPLSGDQIMVDYEK